MNPFADLDALRDELSGPNPSGRMTAAELGDLLARLVWESFSDALGDPELLGLLLELGIPLDEEIPDQRVMEEILIVHLWIHSNTLQLSFALRTPEAAVRPVLNALHRAVFEDMVANGTPEPQIPVFEQRVSARYAEYYQAAAVSDAAVGERVLLNLTGKSRSHSTSAARTFTRRIVEVSHPLRDYLDGVQLSAGT